MGPFAFHQRGFDFTLFFRSSIFIDHAARLTPNFWKR